MNTQAWLLSPDSPLVLRTGRPFGEARMIQGGAIHDFPVPGTTAGALRAAWLDAQGLEHRTHDGRLAEITVRGPVRCKLSTAGRVELWLPRPADARIAVGKSTKVAVRLSPTPEHGAHHTNCDLPHGLRPLLYDGAEPGTQYEDQEWPWWRLGDLQAWLGQRAPWRRSVGQILPNLPVDRRTHASIDPRTLLAIDGQLFADAGIDFTLPVKAAGAEGQQGLLLWVDAPPALQAGLAQMHLRHSRLGADGRTVTYQQLSLDMCKPTCPPEIATALDSAKPGDLLRVYLATPACYLYNGWYPDGLRPTASNTIEGTPEGLSGWRFRLVAAAVGRHFTHAGAAMRNSDGERAFAAKALRRLVPAGSVYWLQVLERGTPFLAERWWQPTCRTEYGRDGHGLALWGAPADAGNS